MFWIGVQLEGNQIVYARLTKKRAKVSILSCQKKHISTDPSLISKSLEQNSYVISGLCASEVLIKELSFPGQKRSTIDKILPFQIEPLLPFSLEDSSIQTNKTAFPLVSCFITKNSALYSHQQQLAELGLDPDMTSSVPRALSRFASFFYPETQEMTVLHIGLHAATLIYKQKEQILFSHVIPLHQHIQWEKELQRALVSLEQKTLIASKSIALTGSFLPFQEKKEQLLSSTPALKNWEFLPTEESFSPYAIPIGLALEGALATDGNSSFFPSKKLSKRLLLKRKKSLCVFAVASLLTMISCWGFGNFMLHQKEKRLFQAFSSVTQDMLPESIAELEMTIAQEQKKLSKVSSYSLYSPLPSVSEILAWLSSYPSSIDIRKVHYELLSFPEEGSKKKPYVGKISLEAMIQDPQEAASFRESLSLGDSLANTNKDFSWEEQDSYYKTTFLVQSKQRQKL